MAMRTGDTTSHERQKMLTHPPHILITTPESARSAAHLAAQPEDAAHRAGRNWTKCTRWSEPSGAHLMLSLARLDELCGRRLQRIGLSTTIQPLQRAADYLAYPSPCMIVAPEIRKGKEIRVLSPLPDLRAVQGNNLAGHRQAGLCALPKCPHGDCLCRRKAAGRAAGL